MEEKVNFIRKKDPTFLFHFSFFIPKTYVTSLIFVSYTNQMSNDRKNPRLLQLLHYLAADKIFRETYGRFKLTINE